MALRSQMEYTVELSLFEKILHRILHRRQIKQVGINPVHGIEFIERHYIEQIDFPAVAAPDKTP